MTDDSLEDIEVRVGVVVVLVIALIVFFLVFAAYTAIRLYILPTWDAEATRSLVGTLVAWACVMLYFLGAWLYIDTDWKLPRPTGGRR